jgi:hypothetical protein
MEVTMINHNAKTDDRSALERWENEGGKLIGGGGK